MEPIIKEQILAIRETGEVNMFDARAVQYIAHCKGFYELVIFLQDYRKEYVEFILYGGQNQE